MHDGQGAEQHDRDDDEEPDEMTHGLLVAA
jgi:hypothetical protein